MVPIFVLVVGGAILVVIRHSWRTAMQFVAITNPDAAPEAPDFGIVEYFTVFTSDARRIAGLIVRPARIPCVGVVVLCHGWGLTKERCYAFARPLVDQGRVVVLFDFRNCGQSDLRLAFLPEPLDHGLRDLEAVMCHVRTSMPERHDGIALMGLSYGGNVALAYAGSCLFKVNALILDSTPLTPYRHFIATTLALIRPRHSLSVSLRWTEPVSVRLANLMVCGDRFYRHAVASSQVLTRTRLLYIVGDKEAYFDPSLACRFTDLHYRGPFEVFRVPRGRHLTNHISGGAQYWLKVHLILAQALGNASLEQAA